MFEYNFINPDIQIRVMCRYYAVYLKCITCMTPEIKPPVNLGPTFDRLGAENGKTIPSLVQFTFSSTQVRNIAHARLYIIWVLNAMVKSWWCTFIG